MPSDLSDAAVARAAIRRLAERRLAPTPDNYAHAWIACGGEPPPAAAMARAANSALRLLADRGEIAAPLRAELLDAMREPSWEPLAALLSRIEAQPAGDGWRELLPALISGLESRHAGWTLARKRDGVLHVIDAHGANPVRLRQRLAQLVEAWRRHPEEAAAAAAAVAAVADVADAADADARLPAFGAGAAAGAPGGAAPTPDPLPRDAPASDACASDTAAAGLPAPTDAASLADAAADAPLQRRVEQSERALAEMRRLLLTLCDSVGSLSDDGSWLRGQMDAVRDVLDQGGDRRALSVARHMIEQTAQTQQRLFERKREAVRQLREALTSAVDQVAGLGGSTGDFSRRLAVWSDEIGRAESIEALDSLARGMASDAQAMQARVDRTHDGVVAVQQRAQDLEAEVERLERELAETSQSMLTDHLTQALNRRGLNEAWTAATLHARRSGQPLSVALLDVDDFKRLNDAFGHLAGDGALKHLSRLLQSRVRPHDSVARWGGEEFVLLLPGSDARSAVQVMQRLQRELTREVYLHENRQVFLTFSAGVAQVRGEEPFESVVARADEAMYAAKHAGKNCVLAA